MYIHEMIIELLYNYNNKLRDSLIPYMVRNSNCCANIHLIFYTRSYCVCQLTIIIMII